MIHVCTDEQCVNFVRTKMRYHLSDGLCINWEKRKRPQKHLQFLNFSKLFNLIACCLSFYSSAFHTTATRLTCMYQTSVTTYWCKRKLAIVDIMQKNPKHSNKEGAVLLETDLYVSCKLIYLHEYRQK